MGDGCAHAARATAAIARLRTQYAVLHRHPIDAFVDGAFEGEGASTLRRWAAALDAAADGRGMQEDGDDDGVVSLLERLLQNGDADGLPRDLVDLVRAVQRECLPRHCPPPDVPPETDAVIERLGLPRKKRHEVRLLAAAAARMVVQLCADVVVDIGSGQGYLSLAVAFLTGVDVVGIDSEQHNHDAALKRMRHAAAGEAAPCRFHTVTHSVGRGEDLSKVLSPYVAPGKRVLLLALHACGDLTSTLLRQATGPLRAHTVGVLSIGCCYQILSEAAVAPLRELHPEQYLGPPLSCDDADATVVVNRNDAPPGFPMSDAVRAAAGGVVLGRRTRMLTAQRLRLGREELRWLLRRQLFRTTFQQLAYQRGGVVAPHKLGVRCKDGLQMSFAAYVRKAAPQCGLDAEELAGHAEAALRAAAPRRTALYLLVALRVLLGPLVETAIVADRAAYLAEHGLHAELQVVFDGDESPRNIAVVAWAGDADVSM